MDRNHPGIPFLAMLLSAALFLSSYLEGRHVALVTGNAPEALSTLRIAVVAFAMLLLIYGAIGFVSILLEGTELRPRVRAPRLGVGAVIGGLLLSGVLVVLAGLFVGIFVRATPRGPSDIALEGVLVGGMFATAALLVVLVRKVTVRDEVVAENEQSEVPW